MNNPIKHTLAQLGLNESQQIIYSSLIAHGPQSVQDLARTTAIKRTTLYTLLDVLVERGLVHKTKSHTQTQFIAENPKHIRERLNDSLEELESYATANAENEPEHIETRTTFLSGSEGFKKIWQDIFDADIDEFLIITDPEEMLMFVKENYITGSIIERKKELGIKSRQLIKSSRYAQEIIQKDPEQNRTSKILSHEYPVPMTTIIYGNSVALISPVQENTMMIVESESFAKTQRSLFESLWQSLS